MGGRMYWVGLHDTPKHTHIVCRYCAADERRRAFQPLYIFLVNDAVPYWRCLHCRLETMTTEMRKQRHFSHVIFAHLLLSMPATSATSHKALLSRYVCMFRSVISACSAHWKYSSCWPLLRPLPLLVPDVKLAKLKSRVNDSSFNRVVREFDGIKLDSVLGLSFEAADDDDDVIMYLFLLYFLIFRLADVGNANNLKCSSLAKATLDAQKLISFQINC